MAHINQQKFCYVVRALFPDHFNGRTVLDIGSLDINGSNRGLFQNCQYTGLDIGPGPNVDVVCKAHEFERPEHSFDTIISTECFEHDRFYRESLRNAVRLLRPGGLLVFTCATTGREEHGTLRANPGSSPFTSVTPEWDSYYKNLTEHDIREAIDVENIFSLRCEWTCGSHTHTFNFPRFQFMTCDEGKDLYFWGVKGAGQTIQAGTVLKEQTVTNPGGM
ncbi:MAG: hypothetical protein RL417_283 [Pseudomonadota bacterium]|jgi:SAM-dependent methyltransferase